MDKGTMKTPQDHQPQDPRPPWSVDDTGNLDELRGHINQLERAHIHAMETLGKIRDEELLRKELGKGSIWKRLWHTLWHGQGLYRDSRITELVDAGLLEMKTVPVVQNYMSIVRKVWFNDSSKYIEILFKEPTEVLRFNRRDATRLIQALSKQVNKLVRVR